MDQSVSTLYINNLPLEATPEEITEKFNQFGKVKDVRICKTPNGASKGFAFLDYETNDEATRAINEGNDMDFKGNKIQVELARHKFRDPPRSKRGFDKPRGMMDDDRMNRPYQYSNRRDGNINVDMPSSKMHNMYYQPAYLEAMPGMVPQYRSETFAPPGVNPYYSQYYPQYQSRPNRMEGDMRYRNDRRQYNRRYPNDYNRDYSYRNSYQNNSSNQPLGNQPTMNRRIRDSPPRRFQEEGEMPQDNQSPTVPRRIVDDDSPPPPRRKVEDDSPQHQ